MSDDGGTFRVVGNVAITERDAHGNIVGQRTLSNTITSGGLSLMRDYLATYRASGAPNPPLYVSVGSGQTIGRFATVSGGGLGETWRTPISQRDKSGLGVIYHAHLGTTDNNGKPMVNYGLVGGEATQQPGTGTLVAVVLDDLAPNGRPKGPGSAFDLDWTLTISGKFT